MSTACVLSPVVLAAMFMLVNRQLGFHLQGGGAGGTPKLHHFTPSIFDFEMYIDNKKTTTVVVSGLLVLGTTSSTLLHGLESSEVPLHIYIVSTW